MNCASDLKKIPNSGPLALNFKSFTQSLEQFFLPEGQNNFGNKIPFLPGCHALPKRVATSKSLLLSILKSLVVKIKLMVLPINFAEVDFQNYT